MMLNSEHGKEKNKKRDVGSMFSQRNDHDHSIFTFRIFFISLFPPSHTSIELKLQVTKPAGDYFNYHTCIIVHPLFPSLSDSLSFPSLSRVPQISVLYQMKKAVLTHLETKQDCFSLTRLNFRWKGDNNASVTGVVIQVNGGLRRFRWRVAHN